MRKSDILLDISLRLFDGGAGAAAPSTGGDAGGDGNKAIPRHPPVPPAGEIRASSKMSFSASRTLRRQLVRSPAPMGKRSPPPPGRARKGM